jgi:hypothetical protein
MAQYPLDITILYANGEVLYASYLDAVVNDVESWAAKTILNITQFGKDVFGASYTFNNDGLGTRTIPLYAAIATLSEDETVTGDWTFNGTGTLTLSQDWTAAGETCADLGTVTTADFTDIAVTTTATFAGATIADLGTVTTADINAGTWQGTIDGAWTAAGQTCADLGTVTTADINAGTVDATIGGTTPAAGTFTSITISS